jgi:hypothetical protein
MSNPNIKELAKVGAAARWAGSTPESRREIMAKVRSSRGKHVCKPQCRCICGIPKWYHKNKHAHEWSLLNKPESDDFQCLEATSGIGTQSPKIGIGISAREFAREYKKHFLGVGTEGMTINFRGRTYLLKPSGVGPTS